MLESKYLTQDGIKSMLQHIYDKGFRYIFFNSDRNVFQASQEKPCFEDDMFMYCDGFRQDFVDGFSSKILNDFLSGANYIDVLEELNIVDWSQVAVDTPVLVRDDDSHTWGRRYFAKFEDGFVYVYPCGTTKWSSDNRDLIPYMQAKLAE